MLIIRVEEFGPWLAQVTSKDTIKMRVELEVVLVEVVEELVGAEHLHTAGGVGGGVRQEARARASAARAARRAPLRS